MDLRLRLTLQSHYDKRPVQYTAISHGCKNDKFQKKIVIVLYLHKNRSWVSNEYLRSMFNSKK